MPPTSCRYELFGEPYAKEALEDVLTHVLDELYYWDPEGLRRAADTVRWMAKSREGLPPSARVHRIAHGVLADVEWPSPGNLGAELAKVIEAIGYPPDAFVIRGFPEISGLPGERAT